VNLNRKRFARSGAAFLIQEALYHEPMNMTTQIGMDSSGVYICKSIVNPLRHGKLHRELTEADPVMTGTTIRFSIQLSSSCHLFVPDRELSRLLKPPHTVCIDRTSSRCVDATGMFIYVFICKYFKIN
jgi:hypothetical protein